MNQTKKTKSGDKWGGAREGAGRKRDENPKERRGISVYLTDEQWAAFEEDAKAQGYNTVGTYINAWAEQRAALQAKIRQTGTKAPEKDM
ncbi:hypothetical protein ACFSR7_06070 [Cohnella sp. GCM10020058]|uniref:hypothetical protein n=1 Tax=Cohnella sp. GCM10020058 TaxID=3317330 RepID=UPI00362D5CF8